MCPDLPVPVLNEREEVSNGGMAMNVHNNILSLKQPCDIVTNANWKSVTKTRFVHLDSNHTFLRADSNHKIERINLNDVEYDYDLIVISDYDKGFLEAEDIAHICNNHDNVFIDSKKLMGDWIRGARYIKINDVEYRRSCEYIDNNIQNKLIRTKGSEGCTFMGKNYKVKKADIKDVSGAGDTFMAGLVVKFLESNNIEKSIKFANQCASEVVTKRGVNTIK